MKVKTVCVNESENCKTYFLLPSLNTLGNCSPNIPLVLSQSFLGLCLGDGADRVLLRLVPDVGAQGHDGLDHVTPVVGEPGDGVDITAVIHGHLNILGGKPGFFRLLNQIIMFRYVFYHPYSLP